MTTIQRIVTILVVVLGTMITRFVPFFIFPEGKTPPAFITYLGTVLPYAVIGLLVVYCLKDAVFTSYLFSINGRKTRSSALPLEQFYIWF